MHEHGTSIWEIHEDLNIGVNFCVWVLQKDGLAVPPFDDHPAGDSSLQNVGLHAELWQSWITEAVIGQRAPANPALAHFGSPALQQRLQELWQIYRSGAADWRRSYRSKMRESISSPEESTRLWDDLVPFQKSLPELRIFWVQYPQVVSFVVPPVSVVLGYDTNASSSTEVRKQILQAAQKLSE